MQAASNSPRKLQAEALGFRRTQLLKTLLAIQHRLLRYACPQGQGGVCCHSFRLRAMTSAAPPAATLHPREGPTCPRHISTHRHAPEGVKGGKGRGMGKDERGGGVGTGKGGGGGDSANNIKGEWLGWGEDGRGTAWIAAAATQQHVRLLSPCMKQHTPGQLRAVHSQPHTQRWQLLKPAATA